ncbi:MAG: hypothetical protein WCC77_03910, partial [Pseudolabrys sp.]
MKSRRLICPYQEEASYRLKMTLDMGRPMSALGHERTFALQKVMSALPPKADICSALARVRLGQ